MSSILSQIEKLASNEGITITRLERQIGASKGVLSRAIANKTDVQSKWLQILVDNYPLYSPEWLLTGRGEMLKPSIPISADNIDIIHQPKCSDKWNEKSIPLYDVAAAANLKTLFINRDQNILGEIHIPNIPLCDGAVYVNGDSMYPLLKSGDIIAYKELHCFDHIIFGEMYLISFRLADDDYLTVKYVNRSERADYIRLVSYNTHHDPIEVAVDCIEAMALVKFSIRKNTMI